MANRNTTRSFIQAFLLDLYRRSRDSRLMRSPAGRRAFEYAYVAYKIMLEAGPIDRLRAFVLPGTWAIDVGANIGVFTLRFACWVSSDGKVIAIEPETANIIALQRRLISSGASARVIALQAVAADQPGTRYLEINPDHPGDHRIGSAGIPVDAVTLDSILAKWNDPPVSLVKIDVQGAELMVLRGAAALLRRSRPALFVEIDDGALRKQNATAAEVFELLASYGYSPYRLRRLGPPLPFDPRNWHDQENYRDLLFLCDRPVTTL